MINYLLTYINELIALLILIPHTLGIFFAISVIMSSNRSSQGTIAWAICLVLFPYITLPIYAIFGKNKFSGYIRAHKEKNKELNKLTKEVIKQFPQEIFVDIDNKNFNVAEKLAKLPFLNGNNAELLIDGEKTFQEIFKAIDNAKNYILIQFFIVKDDDLGNKLAWHLINASKRKCKIYFLYDEIGSRNLKQNYFDKLRLNNISFSSFNERKGFFKHFRLNFRNHRKLVIVDGKFGFVGGHNVGNEYINKSKKFSHWRDTHIKLTGHIIKELQLTFLEDWYWANKEVLFLNWDTKKENQNYEILSLPTGPADKFENCKLFFINAILTAKKRIWIATPYFVPDDSVMSALTIASLKGVEIKIILPDKPDHLLIYLSSFSFIHELRKTNVEFYKYQNGFLHQKIMLIDDQYSTVGTSNFDNRSFKINFEITIIIKNIHFAKQIENMLKIDLSKSKKEDKDIYKKKSFIFKLFVRISNLLSPLQ